MKLGLFLFIFGVILLAGGIVFWQFGQEFPGMLWGTVGIGRAEYTAMQGYMWSAAGLGVTVLGSGLAIGGIVRMVLKR